MRKVTLVTGSSRGIGKAIVTDFAQKGYDVVINYRKEEKEAKTVTFLASSDADFINDEIIKIDGGY